MHIGNSWTYHGSVRIESFNLGGTIAFQEFLEVRVVRQDGEPGDGGEVIWTVEFIGIPTPSSPLAKEAKIACSSTRRDGMGAPIPRLGEARAFDIRGRRIVGVAGR